MSELTDDLFKVCTVWVHSGFDDWTGTDTYLVPVVKACWFKKEFKQITDSTGKEITSTGYYLSDDPTFASLRDFILDGEHTALNPADANAEEVVSLAVVPDEDFALYKAYV